MIFTYWLVRVRVGEFNIHLLFSESNETRETSPVLLVRVRVGE